MMCKLVCATILACAVSLLGCSDDEESYTTENCAVVLDASGQPYTLCCRLSCSVDYDSNDYSEQCVETTTCTAPTGESCQPGIALAFRYPACF
jgi:hypothetical protein